MVGSKLPAVYQYTAGFRIWVQFTFIETEIALAQIWHKICAILYDKIPYVDYNYYSILLTMGIQS